MAIQQSLIGVGNNPKFVGYTTVTSGDVGIVENLTFNYPDGQTGDLIVAYVVSENMSVPVLSADWTTVYSNTTTALNGSNSGRLLAYKKRSDGESNATVFVSGGGNATCVALRGLINSFSNVKEWTANTSTVQFANTSVKPKQVWVAMFNQDGGVNTNSTIAITNTNATYANTPGDRRSMAIGYVQNTNITTAKTNYFTIDAENAYGMTFEIS